MSGDHGHAHADSAMLATDRGVWAVKVSIAGLFATAILQGAVVLFSGSAALLADTLHNFGDAATGIPLLIAFALSRRAANRRYTYGYHRAEDLAGIAVLLAILASAGLAAWESYRKLIQLQVPEHMEVAMLAAFIGFLGNEGVARLRISVGNEIGSAALVADGHHARTDSFTSLGALLGIFGAYVGFPIADPIAGLIISALILLIVIREAGPPVLARLMDAVEPDVVAGIEREAKGVAGVQQVQSVRARWLGHQVRAELEIGVDGALSVAQGHAIAEQVRHALLHRVPRLAEAVVHVDPSTEDGAHELTAHHFDGRGHEDEHDHDHGEHAHDDGHGHRDGGADDHAHAAHGHAHDADGEHGHDHDGHAHADEGARPHPQPGAACGA